VEVNSILSKHETLLLRIYHTLLRAYGPQGWWPVSAPGNEFPAYTGGPAGDAQRFEVAVGAVLTQHTAWKNAASAVTNLIRRGMLEPEKLSHAGERKIAEVIRPAGYYNQKAGRLRRLASLFASAQTITRESLLELNGIGPETADSIMLYAFGKPSFVVDAYTRRIFSRLGVADGRAGYEEMRTLFERHLPQDPVIYQEFHALIVEHGKRHCRRRPVCAGCPLRQRCPEWGKVSRKK
jgi:endonuclease-3 related protein